MPWLRDVMDPRFRTIGEAIQFFKEMIEGLQYMHENNVAHRDCARNNMGMDANSMYTHIPCDPFATDVYILGTMIRTSLLDGEQGDMYISRPGVHGFEFLRPLVNDMITDDPSNRPTMNEVASRFSSIVGKLRWWKLRSRAVQKDEFLTTPFRALYHLFWTASMMLLLKPAIPSPKDLH
ncbi:hypothetical protein C8R41DRAFT_608063 [Lentinula lateritia]|uniref:Protein kinase domain-containing protein n=1 Tax=Lentinula lateritia TaxID=40482 RepID=A0ABQ8VTU9_9AGAR|nr:hypothetical protein C8R41DRAFT_608063 [Lentinula lateritia]